MKVTIITMIIVCFVMYVQKLQSCVEIRHRYLQSWAFPETSTLSTASTLEKLIDCLKTLYDQVTQSTASRFLICFKKNFLMSLFWCFFVSVTKRFVMVFFSHLLFSPSSIFMVS